MDYLHDRDRSLACLRTAVALMGKHVAVLDPLSYAIWYDYAAGGSTELKQALDEAIASGGLMSQEQSNNRYGLPGLSGMTGIGQLFGQKSVINKKRELVILMRSTVIRDENSWRDLASESQARLQGLDPRQQRHIEWQ